MSLAHYFTLLRIVISPLFPLIYLEYEWLGIPYRVMPFILFFLLSICEFSDLIDGMIARRRNQVTDLGKVLDPMADSVTKISLFLTLTQGPVALPMILVLVFFYRDFFISTLRTLCALRGFALAARFSGKMKAVIQAGVLFLILILLILYSRGMLSNALLHLISLWAVSIAALYTVASAVDYIYSNRNYVKKAWLS
ncbi:MAG: pgsA1 [Parachlamydiales bacterium]|nr:pgsA1 [Parachlamydiales bacterium]